MTFPHRTVALIGALALVFLVGAAAVRQEARPSVSADAQVAVAALEDRLAFSATRVDVVLWELRVKEPDEVAPQIAALAANADDIARAAESVRGALRGLRADDARAAADAGSARAVQAATAVRTAAQLLGRYAAGEAQAALAVQSVQAALLEIGAARHALAPVLAQ